MGEMVTVIGIAENAHQGAVVTLSDGNEVYVDGLRWWDNGLLRERVMVTGTLREKKLAPDPEDNGGIVSHGMFGESLVLEGPTWEKQK
jgi:hypothetical protein